VDYRRPSWYVDLPEEDRDVGLVKSRQRIADHGEVFTPAWMVEAMLELVKAETERIDSRVLEPACGSGNFLVPVLRRKLAAVELKFGKSDFEKRHYALFGLMCVYGIELLDDYVAECHKNMLEILADYIGLDAQDDLCRAATYVLSQNIVQVLLPARLGRSCFTCRNEPYPIATDSDLAGAQSDT